MESAAVRQDCCPSTNVLLHFASHYHKYCSAKFEGLFLIPIQLPVSTLSSIASTKKSARGNAGQRQTHKTLNPNTPKI